MSVIWTKDIDEILREEGDSLNSIGIQNWALPKREALFAISELKKMGVAITGGDVYRLNGDSFELTYDNWYCQRLDSESGLEYINRSVLVASEYIKGYVNHQKGNICFAIVPLI